jgi:hypothetical protein
MALYNMYLRASEQVGCSNELEDILASLQQMDSVNNKYLDEVTKNLAFNVKSQPVIKAFKRQKSDCSISSHFLQNNFLALDLI